jgi:hypothetical protein
VGELEVHVEVEHRAKTVETPKSCTGDAAGEATKVGILDVDDPGGGPIRSSARLIEVDRGPRGDRI